MAGIMSPKECFDLVSALKGEYQHSDLRSYTRDDRTRLYDLSQGGGGRRGRHRLRDLGHVGRYQSACRPSPRVRAQQMGYDCGVDTKELKEINDYFIPIKNKFTENGLFDPTCSRPRPMRSFIRSRAACSPTLSAQLKAQNAIDSLDQVLDKHRACVPTWATRRSLRHFSQMVRRTGNGEHVLLGGRYKSIGKEIKSYIHGEYGHAPGEVNEELAKKGAR